MPDFTDELNAIRDRHIHYLRAHDHPYQRSCCSAHSCRATHNHDHAHRRACCSAHATADDGTRLLEIVDQLTAELDQLRAEVDRERTNVE